MTRVTASVSKRSENVPTYTSECDPGRSLASRRMSPLLDRPRWGRRRPPDHRTGARGRARRRRPSCPLRRRSVGRVWRGVSPGRAGGAGSMSSAQSKTRSCRFRVARHCHGRLQIVGPALSVWSARIRRSRVTSISSAGLARCPGTAVVLVMTCSPASPPARTPPRNPRRNSRGPQRPKLLTSLGGSMNVTATPCLNALRVKACSRLIAGFHGLFEHRVIVVMTPPRLGASPGAPGPTGPTTTGPRDGPRPFRPRPRSPRRVA